MIIEQSEQFKAEQVKGEIQAKLQRAMDLGS